MRNSLVSGLIWGVTILGVATRCFAITGNVTRDCRVVDQLTDYEMTRSNTKERALLSRKRRYLTFPQGSAFVITLSILKSLLFTQTTPWSLTVEFDVIWPIPSSADLRGDGNSNRRIFSKNNRNNSWRWRLRRRRHKRELYSNFETALDSQGFPGKQCVLRTICEARSFLSPPGFSFVEDLLRIIFSNVAGSKNEMDDYDRAYRSKEDCELAYDCPVSILGLLLSFDDNYT